MFRLLVNLITK